MLFGFGFANALPTINVARLVNHRLLARDEKA